MTDYPRYRKSCVCGNCWMNPERRKYYMLHSAARCGLCDFCGRETKVWVTMEPTRRTFLELLDYYWPHHIFYGSAVVQSKSDRASYFWDLDYVSEEGATAADKRKTMRRRNLLETYICKK